MEVVLPGSSAFSESWLGPAANFLDEVSLVVSVVVVAVAAVCTVIVQASLGHTSCTTKPALAAVTAAAAAAAAADDDDNGGGGGGGGGSGGGGADDDDDDEVLSKCSHCSFDAAPLTTWLNIKPRFRRLFRTGHRSYIRRAVAKSRRLENSARLKRRALGKVGKYVRAKRANIANMQKTLAGDGDLLIALQLEQSRLARHNVDLSKKIAMMTKRLQMWAEIQRLQSLQPSATTRNPRKPHKVGRAQPKMIVGPRPSWH
ncbi:hypothetical protein LSAT2_016927 [Lamellibrachia satsuma]|nr:hypothetical protein LSAT2_016927 [Lamellibrachia satsuma]